MSARPAVRELIGWRTDAGNRPGTAHLYSASSGNRNSKELVRSACGREVLRHDLQAEIDSLRRCARCQKVAARTDGTT